MKVTTVCYGKKQVWNSREEAKAYFLEGAMSCEGSESDRYFTIYCKLSCGEMIATDSM